MSKLVLAVLFLATASLGGCVYDPYYGYGAPGYSGGAYYGGAFYYDGGGRHHRRHHRRW